MTTIITREEVGPRDVLFSNHEHLHNHRHVGNRRYRRIIHLFRSKYAQVAENSRERSEIADEIFEILMGSGYRFLKNNEDNDNYYYINSEKEMREKVGKSACYAAINLGNKFALLLFCTQVGYSLHYELSKLTPTAIRRGHKELTLESLMGGKLSIVDYVEYLVDMEQYDNFTIESTIPAKDQSNNSKEKVEVRIDESTFVQAPSTFNAMLHQNKNLAFKENNQDIQREQSSETSEHSKRFINEIVKSTIACNTLPVAGTWKFYPLEELGNVVDLGADQEGWQLHLQPILHDADPMSFDVSSGQSGNDQ